MIAFVFAVIDQFGQGRLALVSRRWIALMDMRATHWSTEERNGVTWRSLATIQIYHVLWNRCGEPCVSSRAPQGLSPS